jgi:formylglycine-generating enzyme required for sulfatase activity
LSAPNWEGEVRGQLRALFEILFVASRAHGCRQPACDLRRGVSRLAIRRQRSRPRQTATAKALGLPKHLTVDLGNGITLELALIPAGRFMMGSSESETSSLPALPAHPTNESPLHEVNITRPFYMSAYKVTQEQYQQVMGANPSRFSGQNLPVDAVTWDDAANFARRAAAKANRKVHLPTEAQWEYAVRAGTGTRYTFGEDENKIGEYAWYRENGKGMTHPVGEKPPNAWGLFDVHGLLWEYCSDFYADSYAGAGSTDPSGPASGQAHATRGGTWGSRPPFLRSAIRVPSPAVDSAKDLLSRFGFRVAVDIDSVP